MTREEEAIVCSIMSRAKGFLSHRGHEHEGAAEGEENGPYGGREGEGGAGREGGQGQRHEQRT